MKTKTNCKRCGGSKTAVTSEGELINCPCTIIEMISAIAPKSVLGAVIPNEYYDAPWVHPLKSQYIIGDSDSVNAAIKLALLTNIPYGITDMLITSDTNIINISFGDDLPDGTMGKFRESYLIKPAFAVISLTARRKNKMAPDIMYEQLKARIDTGKPTWVVNPVENPWGHGSPSYSNYVMYQLERLGTVNLSSGSEKVTAATMKKALADAAPQPVKKGIQLVVDNTERMEKDARDLEKLGRDFGGGYKPSKSKKSTFKRREID